METTEKRPMLVEQPIIVRSYDVDYMQIVNNTVYVKWFEDLRMAVLDQYFPLNDMISQGCSPILAETHISYKHSVTLKSKPTGRVWIDSIDRSRWTARFEIFEGDTVYAVGSQVGYYFNLEAKRPVRFPADFIAYYNSL